MNTPISTVAKILIWELGTRENAISYARRIEAVGGPLAGEYGRVADFLELSTNVESCG